MGYLALGAMAGAANEYVKQSGEERKNKYQEIRDRRLAELQQENMEFESGLTSKENIRQEQAAGEAAKTERDWNAKNYEAPLTSNVYRDGKKVQTGEHRPAASSTAKKSGELVEMNNGKFLTEDQIRLTYDSIWKANTDEFGRRIGDFDLPPYDEWRNSRVAEHERINPDYEPPPDPNAEPSTADIQAANEWYDKNADWKTRDVKQFGMSEEEVKYKKAREIMMDRMTKSRGDGMLSRSNTGTAKPKKPKTSGASITLSGAAKTDPNLMYYELINATIEEDVSEQEIIDLIRKHFNDPTWDIPRD
jgi:hypothetical protein